MAHYVLRDGLSFCRVDAQLVFLDVANDRYFRLPAAMEHALTSHLESGTAPSADVSGLVFRGILVEADAPAMPALSIPRAMHSAMETPALRRTLRCRDLLDVLCLVAFARFQLKFGSLKAAIEGFRARSRSATPAQPIHGSDTELQLLDAAARFRAARLFVPIEMRCLLDSIAMIRFLHRRGLHAHIVFGVALDPFSAHCWVQAGDLVLNDTVGNVDAHTPILVA